MGMFDTVHFTCPRCDSGLSTQSKAGDCSLADYSYREVPPEIAKDIHGEDIWCERCKIVWKATIIDKPQMVRMYLVRDDD